MTSLGAGGSLIAAAVCALVLFGGLLVFRGAVDDPAEARGGDVTMPGGAASAVASSLADPARDVGDVAAVERRARPRRTASERRVRRPRTPPSERRVRRPSSPAAPVADAPASGGTTSSGGTGTEAEVTPPAGTVKRTVQKVRETADPVVEVVPEPVQPVVDEVVDTVEQVGGTVDETVEQVDEALAPVTGLLPR